MFGLVFVGLVLMCLLVGWIVCLVLGVGCGVYGLGFVCGMRLCFGWVGLFWFVFGLLVMIKCLVLCCYVGCL